MRSRSLLFLFTLLLCSNSTLEATAADPITVAFGIKMMDDTLNSAISNIGYEARKTSFAAFQNAHLLLEDFKIIYADSLNKTITELKVVEKQAYDDMQALINDLSQNTHKNLVEIQQISDQLARSITNLPFTDRQPRVFCYTPQLVSDQQFDSRLYV